MAEQISKKHRHQVIMSSRRDLGAITSVPAVVALPTIICWTLVMAPKSVTSRRHDHLVSVLFGDLLNHSYITFLMFLYLVCLKFRLDSSGNIKVGDFGLAEDIYNCGYFRQEGLENIRLPYKWMAVESLTDNLFSEKTDVVRMIIYPMKGNSLI